jgi:hypothetical protein
MTGLYDNQGVLRFCGEDRSACLAYAELFGLRDDDFTLVSLVEPFDGEDQAAAA